MGIATAEQTRVLEEFQIKNLVRAGLYADRAAVVTDALRHLLIHRPDYRTEMAVAAYWAGEISLGKAAEIAGLCYEDMRELLRDRGVSLRLGPATHEEALAEIQALEEFLAERARSDS